MIGKKINQLATELAPVSTDLTIIGDPDSGVSKKITLAQLGAIFSGAVSFYTNLAGFPAVGDINVIYCAKDTQKLYLWSGSTYTEVFPSQALLNTYQLRSEKGVSNGYASLDSGGKVPISQLPSSIMEYKGTWNAATNTPTLANGTGDTGDVYICNVAGTVNFGAGPLTFAVGDYVIYSGSIWQRSSGAVGTVTSVAVSRSGDALAITGSPVTTSGTINIGFAGNSTQYINGAGNLVTFPGVINEAQNLITEVYNKTGATLTKGTVVYINGGQGNLPTITKALATGDSTSAQTYGIVRNDITNNNNGYVVVAGRISDLDTQAFTEGTQLYLSSTTAGTYTSTKQYAPNHLVYVGIVVRAHPTQGVVEVKIQNGYEMDELHNVAAQSPDNNDILQYKTATSLWTKVAGTTTNISEGSNLYYTDARSRAALSFTAGSGAYNSTTGVITIPTNTNQLTNGANYITLGSLSASSPLSYNNGTGAFSISQANTSTNGFLSSTDWNTFNGKQAALNGTGFVKISGTTISYDNSTYYLASNPNAYIPLTALSAGAGISYNNTTGVITSTITQYTDALARAAISLTTSGTSGAATYNSTTGVLNVPQYAPDLSGYVPTSRTLTINGTAYDLSANRSWSVGTVTSVGLSSATSGVTIGSTPITTSGTITLAIATASGSQQGLLSSTDWTTFNNKQNALTNPVTGTGTTNYLPKFTGASTIGNSILQDDGTNVSVGYTTNPSLYKLDVNGTGRFSGALSGTSASFSGTIQGASLTDGFITIGAAQINRTSATVELQYGASGNVRLFGNGTYPITFTASTGAATFSSSVTATGGLYVGSGTLGRNAFSQSDFRIAAPNDTNILNGIASNTSMTIKSDYYGGGSATPLILQSGANSNQLYLATSGNVGIGTASPSYKLDVIGSFSFTTGGNYLQYNSGILYHGNYYQYPSGNDYLLYARTSGALLFGSNDTERMRITSGGNVGIGTTNAYTRLRVDGDISAEYTSTIYLDYAPNPNSYKKGFSGVNQSTGSGRGLHIFNYDVDSNDGINFWLGTNSARVHAAIITNAGNVGIGTTSPSTFLHVLGSNTSARGQLSIQSNNTSNAAKATWYYDTFNSGEIGTTGSDFYGLATNNFLFYAGGAERMRITSGGNVGIGTTSPNSLFVVNGGDADFRRESANSRILVTAPGIANTVLGFNNSGSTATGVSNNTGYVGVLQGYPLAFITESAERMRITSNGRLLVGTTTDNTYSRLQVSGSTWIGTTKGTYFTDGASYSSIVGLNQAVTAYNGLELRASGTDGQLYLSTNGNVGIGTTSPSVALQVDASGGGIIRATRLGAGSAYVQLEADGTNGTLTSSSTLIMNAGGSERMRITSGGNVEINTGSIKTGEPDTGWGRAAIKIGASVSGTAFNVTRYLPVSVDGTVYYINLNSSTP